MVDKQKSLEQVSIGSHVVITHIEGSDQLSKRLLEMGLFEGEEIEVIAKAPLGDPIEIQLSNYTLSLRIIEAKRIFVSQPGS